MDTVRIEGTIEEIIYQSTDGYCVLGVEAGVPTVVVGSLAGLAVGERVCFFGYYKEHKLYGMQFCCTSYEATLPSDEEGIELFLGGGFIHGVGPVTASRIVEMFGENTFDVIENDYSQLAKVKGVSKKLAASIHEAFLEYSSQKIVYSRLMGMGLTSRQAQSAAKALGTNAAEIIRENPYILISCVRGIDFITADKIAQKLGIEKNSLKRIGNGILHVLKKSMNVSGYTCVPEDMLISTVSNKLFVEKELAVQALNELTVKNLIERKKYGGARFVFIKYAYTAESKSAVKLFKLLKSEKIVNIKNLHEKVHIESDENGFSDEQKNALEIALENNVCVITGGPGTGKTTILKALIKILGASGYNYALAAPTGRAAKRMEEACGAKASTIHRLLEYRHDDEIDEGECKFGRNESNPLEFDAIIVDEASMLDIFLLKSLCEAVDLGCKIVFVGDSNQLPSVGAGNVMEDLIESSVIPVCRLTKIYRNEGGIANAAFDVLNGKIPETSDEFVFIECENETQVKTKIEQIYCKYYNEGADIQVIAPVKRGNLGTVEINNMLREKVNPFSPQKKELTIGDNIYRTGDRIMQIKNNYSKEWTAPYENGEGVFNGDIGKIDKIYGGDVYVDFDEKSCIYSVNDLNELDGAYCYTIHKSQGSEFDIIVIPMMYPLNPFFSNNLIYTGITRGKSKVILVGNIKTFEYMIGNTKKNRRFSALKKELKNFESML